MTSLAQHHARPHRAFDALPSGIGLLVLVVLALLVDGIAGNAGMVVLIASRFFYLYHPSSRMTD